MPRNRDKSRFGVVLELAVTTFDANMTPAVSLDQVDDVSNFHNSILSVPGGASVGVAQRAAKGNAPVRNGRALGAAFPSLDMPDAI